MVSLAGALMASQSAIAWFCELPLMAFWLIFWLDVPLIESIDRTPL
jgi:hypothetical protein